MRRKRFVWLLVLVAVMLVVAGAVGRGTPRFQRT
jgi:hypothetical protein